MSGGIGHLIGSGPLVLAAPVAAAAGALTFASPCVLPLVPGYLSYVTGMSGTTAQRSGRASGRQPASGEEAAAAGGGVAVATQTATGPAGLVRGRTVLGAFLFVFGFSALFAVYGGASGALGSMLQTHAAGLAQVLGGLTIVLGLLFSGLFERIPITGRIMRPSFRPRAGLAGAPLLGAMFGLSWTPCVGPTLIAVLTLSYSAGTAVRGAVLMFVYGLGLGVPFLIAAALFQRGVTAFGWARRHARLIAGLGGAMLVAVGVLEVSGLWNGALAWLKTHWVGSYTSPL